MSVLAFICDRRQPVPVVRGARPLTAAEREWLEAVPVDPCVEFAGMSCVWVRSFFCGWVRHGLERGCISVRVEPDGSLVATAPAGDHVLRPVAAASGEGTKPRPAAQTAGRRPQFFGTHAARTHKDD